MDEKIGQENILDYVEKTPEDPGPLVFSDNSYDALSESIATKVVEKLLEIREVQNALYKL